MFAIHHFACTVKCLFTIVLYKLYQKIHEFVAVCIVPTATNVHMIMSLIPILWYIMDVCCTVDNSLWHLGLPIKYQWSCFSDHCLWIVKKSLNSEKAFQLLYVLYLEISSTYLAQPVMSSLSLCTSHTYICKCGMYTYLVCIRKSIQ